ncbi:MAG TPA: caspase family protein [Casimicrobiaceae bacterium]|nr:caspase family protein [Casimicrobiaceae bacterium]
MLGNIAQIDHEQLRLLLHRGWLRRINAVHLHHTWRPNHAQWRGVRTVQAIRRYHVEELGWSDIAQHLTIGPDGSLWTGRSLDRAPASVSGHNGTGSEGPFMIEMAGDFDVGQDTLRDPQAQSVHQVVAAICAAFRLDVSSIRFHNEFTTLKTCPGSSLALADFRNAVGELLRPMLAAPVLASDAARAYASQVAVPGAADAVGRALEAAEAEPRYDAAHAARSWGDGAAERDLFARCKPEEIEVFRSHVIDLSGGQLSDSGCYTNTEADLDELIARMDRWVAGHAGTPARIVFFAHGGLVDEQSGLGVALRDYRWWLANDAYPVFLVWETGFLEVFQQNLRQQQAEAGARAFITDPIIELTLGPAFGRPTWDRIKSSAFLSSAEFTGTGGPGGAAIFLRKLAAWYAGREPKKVKVEFHAVGHSAGSIFHCHFLPALEAAFKDVPGAPKPIVRTLALLAPAVRADLFRQMLVPRVGAAIGACAMFTMKRQSELADNVIGIYRKSLLYFVRNACERPTHSTAILGLEESVRDDAALAGFFGLGAGAGKAQAVLSPTASMSGDAASMAVHHGDFDNDSPTMNSVMRRILAIPDAQPLPCAHLPVEDIRACSGAGIAEGGDRELGARGLRRAATGAGGGARNALCIGIDDYGPQSLDGCVADSQLFADVLQKWGFTVQSLTNERATRKAIASAIDGILAASGAGDVVVVQYAGHGTQLPDLNGDESDGFDEAWVPYDFGDGEFVIDDDLGTLFDRGKDRGIQLVVFTDCCHSGTSTRFIPPRGARHADVRSRYMAVPRDIVDLYERKRGAARNGVRSAGQDRQGWEIHFAACQDRQSAYERDGHGDFTRATTKAMSEALSAPQTYAGLADAVSDSFAGNTMQSPQLRAPPDAGALRLFAASRDVAVVPDAISQGDSSQMLGTRIDQLAIAIRQLSKKIDDL